MEVETATRKVLIADPTVNGYVSGKVYKYRLEVPVDGTGGLAIVVRRNGGWTNPDPINTAEFPLVEMLLYCDSVRDTAGEITTRDGEEGAWALFRAVDRRLHAVRDEWWPDQDGLKVVTCARYGEPRPVPIAGVEAAVVLVTYAMQVVHS